MVTSFGRVSSTQSSPASSELMASASTTGCTAGSDSSANATRNTQKPAKRLTTPVFRTTFAGHWLFLLLLLMCHSHRMVNAQFSLEDDECHMVDGESQGICRLQSECEWLKRKLETREYNFSDIVICGFLKNEPIVCCADNELSSRTSRPSVGSPSPETNDDDDFTQTFPTPTPTATTTTELPSPVTRSALQRPAIEACGNYSQLAEPTLDFHILGGAPTYLGEFPHMIVFGYPSDDINVELDYLCGGSLISDRWILTAAHCMNRRAPTVARAGKVYLFSNEDEVEGLTLDIAEIIRHPNYVVSRNYADIALVRLAQPIQLNSTIRPACLYTDVADLDESRQLIVTGWGDMGNISRSTVLLKTNITTVALGRCNSSLVGYSSRPNPRFPLGLENGQMCAFGHLNDACQGDSGGPLQLVGNNDMSTVVGVVSFGIACGSTLPSVYTRVAFYLDWIESIVWPDFRR